MAQLSRPYQIALGALVVLAAVWLVALRPHASSGEAPSSAGVSPPRPATSGQAATAGSASGAASIVSAVAPGAPGASSRAGSIHPAVPAARASTRAPANQRAVEAELAENKTVVLLFWNPRGADDRLVHHELQLLVRLHHDAASAKTEELRHADRFYGLELDKRIVVHEAPASAVATFGSITRGIQVYSTPTLVIVNPRGQASTLSGFTDAYSIEQAIEENRRA